jgi:hypothetical protein
MNAPVHCDTRHNSEFTTFDLVECRSAECRGAVESPTRHNYNYGT